MLLPADPRRRPTARLLPMFQRIKCFTVDHATPFDTVQNFLFRAFRKHAS
ncbi:MAG: hypothetical protein JST66_07745 [Bacteroidetes bacterium]|nr:hypothetical protein [Bacteroidota bacterium]